MINQFFQILQICKSFLGYKIVPMEVYVARLLNENRD